MGCIMDYIGIVSNPGSGIRNPFKFIIANYMGKYLAESSITLRFIDHYQMHGIYVFNTTWKLHWLNHLEIQPNKL